MRTEHSEASILNEELQRPADLTQSDDGWRRFTGNQMRLPVRPDEMPKRLFGDLISHGEFVILAADSGVGKSAIGAYMVKTASQLGAKLFEHPSLANRAGSLKSEYIDKETDELTMRIRHGSIWEGEYEDSKGVPEDVLAMSPQDQREWTKRPKPSLLDRFFEAVVIRGVEFCVLDSMTKATTSTQSRDFRMFLEELQNIRSLAEKMWGHKVTVVLLAHVRKDLEVGKLVSADELYGGMEQKADADVVLRAAASRFDGAFYIAQKKTSRIRKGSTFCGGATGQVLLISRVPVVRPGCEYEEYHLEMESFDPVYETEVMRREHDNLPLDEKSSESKTKSLATYLITIFEQRSKSDKDKLITPSMVHNWLKSEKKRDETITASSVDTITKLWPIVQQVLTEQGREDVVSKMGKL